jgi:hypothetical protein
MRSILGDLTDALDRFLAALADDVGCAELQCERGPLRVAAKQNDPLGTEALCRDHTAKPDRAVADDSNRLPRADLRCHSRVVAGSHYIGEREQRRHQAVVSTDRQRRPHG